MATETPNMGHLLIQVVKPISNEKILPDTFPLRGLKSTTIEITASRGEYEPASFVLRSLEGDLEGISIEATALRFKENAIPADQVDIKVVKVWYQAPGAWVGPWVKKEEPRMFVPELLLNDDSLISVDHENKDNYIKLRFSDRSEYVSISDSTLKEDRVIHSSKQFPVNDSSVLQPINLKYEKNKQIWITVHIPEKVPPGKYIGKILISSREKKIAELTLTVNVLPFKLSQPSLTYSIYYRGQLDPLKSTVSSEYKNYTQLRADLKNMWNHGVTNPNVYQNPWNKKLFEEVLKIRKEIGMVGQSLYLLGFGIGNEKSNTEINNLENNARLLLQTARKFGGTDLYIYGIDEPKLEKLKKMQTASESVRKGGVKVFSAINQPGFSEIGDGILDLAVYTFVKSGSDQERVAYHRNGIEIFGYANPQAGPENPDVFRRNYGILLWKYGYDGAMIYAYQDSFGSVWNDFDHTIYRDHALTYPTTEGVIDTIAWEGLREGIDDVRYLTTLEKLMKQVSTESSEDLQAWHHEAENLLREIKRSNPKQLDLDKVRSDIIDIILKFL